MRSGSQKKFLIGLFKKWRDLQTMIQLEWLQIEVTTRCNASCYYCPRTTYRNYWDSRDLSFENFKTLLPVIAYAKMIHLQGWGEPFLHPHLFEMIALAKKTGCKVGTTTNGMLLNRRRIDQLVKSGIDHVAFSLTGIGERNDRARHGTQFARVLQTISGLDAQKRALRVETPTISIAYLLLRSHLPDINKIIPALADTGAQQVVISTLDFVANQNLEKERLTPANQAQYRELKSLFDKLEDEAEKKGIGLFYNFVLPSAEGGTCTEKPRRASFVSSDGNVSPCVFTSIPGTGASCMIDGEEAPCRNLTFGSIADDTLPAIWKSVNYREFRKSFGLRPYPLCQSCPKRYEGSE